MFGFMPFAGSPFASVGSGATMSESTSMIGEAIIKANANVIWKSDVFLLGEADINVDGTINGSGWTRINPDTPEWDVTQSSDWNRIN